jgi:hypothetical protein
MICPWNLRGRLSTVDLLLLTSLDKLAAFDIANIIYFFTKQVTLMRRSTIISLPLQLVFPVYIH